MKPYVKNQKTGEILSATTRVLSGKDTEALVRLYCLSDGLSREDATGKAKQLAALGKIIGMFACGELCAACAVYIPKPDKRELAEALDMGELSAAVCGVLDGIAEHPDYTENGLEREAVLAALSHAWRLGMSFAAVAVKPSERERLLTLMSINGMRIKCQTRINGYHLYYVLCCVHSDKRLYTIYERYSLNDTYGITRILEDGYDGIATFRSKDGDFIWMAK